MKPTYILMTLIFSLVLAACSPTTVTEAGPDFAQAAPNLPTLTAVASSGEGEGLKSQQTETAVVEPTQSDPSELPVLSDNQGAVAVFVQPIELGSQEPQLKFEVGLETHSVDLSMDLAPLATLTTDTGFTVQATEWDAPRGGHHISGTLLFPAQVDGEPVLNGASTLMLVIKDLDAPERLFTWDLK